LAEHAGCYSPQRPRLQSPLSVHCLLRIGWGGDPAVNDAQFIIGPPSRDPYAVAGCCQLFAGHCRRRRVRSHSARNLRCYEKCRNDGRQAYESEKLIHREHSDRPPRSRFRRLSSIYPLRGLLTAGQKLVCVGRPRNGEQRQNRYNGQCSHTAIVVFDCGQKRQSLVRFWGQQEKHRGGNEGAGPLIRVPRRGRAPWRS
jgi:hypothetical protein